MRYEILKHLDHGNPTLALVCDFGFTTQTHDFNVLDHGSDHVGQ